MTGVEIFLLLLVLLLFVIGIAGLVLPVIPALPVMWVGILLYAIGTGFEAVDARLLIITGAIMIVGTLLDIIAQAIGAKAFGATWAGMFGAIVGSILGLIILNVLGLFIGAFLGTFIGEYFMHREQKLALKAAWGTFVGFLFGIVMKLILAIAMIVLFFSAVF